jgi:hypothetical protein
MKRSRHDEEDAGEEIDGDGDDEINDDDNAQNDDDDDNGKLPSAMLSKDFFEAIESDVIPAEVVVDDGADRVNYDDLIMHEDPAPEAQPKKPKRKAKSLLELAQGPNRDAATNMIEDSVYAMAIVCNFVSFRCILSH